jgi:23S rRNA G2445 N2-methylase RlmL
VPRHTFFATCAPGLESVLHAEGRALKLAKCERQIGGMRFEGTQADAWRANLELRTAVRVLWRLSRFDARDADALYRAASEVDWSELIAPEGRLWIDAQTRDSQLNHSQFIAQRTKDAIVDQLRARTGSRPSVDRDAPDLKLHVHVSRDRVTLSVDTSGESLHKRGWRRAQGRAPLAETLAAGVVALSDWDRRSPLLDPFVGSGTILIEAGLAAAGIAPGIFRGAFAFERLPGHDAGAYAAFRAQLEQRGQLPRKLRLIGSDHDPGRLEAARENAQAVGLGEQVELELADAREFAPRPGWNAWIVTNAPYGERVGSAEKLEPLYRDFGARLRERCEGYTLALLTAEPRLADALGLRGMKRRELVNGGIECGLLTGRL